MRTLKRRAALLAAACSLVAGGTILSAAPASATPAAASPQTPRVAEPYDTYGQCMAARAVFAMWDWVSPDCYYHQATKYTGWYYFIYD